MFKIKQNAFELKTVAHAARRLPVKDLMDLQNVVFALLSVNDSRK